MTIDVHTHTGDSVEVDPQSGEDLAGVLSGFFFFLLFVRPHSVIERDTHRSVPVSVG